MFINFSNHPSSSWSKAQLNEAGRYGEIRDIPFPNVPPEAAKEDVLTIAEDCVREILRLAPDCVLCQGEFCLAYDVIRMLKERNIRVVAACSRRDVQEVVKDGVTGKFAVFHFVQFREY